MTFKAQIGLIALIALIALSAAAAVFVSVLIARRQDISRAARRAFLLSNAALILCLASVVAGISIYPSAPRLGLALGAVAAISLVLKFVFVRQFAHRIRQEHPRAASENVTLPAPNKGT